MYYDINITQKKVRKLVEDYVRKSCKITKRNYKLERYVVSDRFVKLIFQSRPKET